MDKAIAWKSHDSETLGDLVGCVSRLGEAEQDAIWNLVEEWSKSAYEDDKSWLRERIRVSALTRRALKQGAQGGSTGKNLERARQAYDSLLPSDVILKHGWLFRRQWVEESADEPVGEDIHFGKRDERIDALRKNALKEVLETRGMESVLRLAEMGQASNVVGGLLPRIFEPDEKLVEAILSFAKTLSTFSFNNLGKPDISSEAEVLRYNTGNENLSLLKTLSAL